MPSEQSKKTKKSISSASFKTLNDQEKKMFDDLLDSMDWLNDELPAELIKFLKEVMHANDKTITFFQRQSLTTAKDIAAFGINEITDILSKFHESQFKDSEFLQFLTHLHFLAEHLKAVAEEKQSQDTALATLNPKPFLEHLPDNKAETNKFIAKIDKDDFLQLT